MPLRIGCPAASGAINAAGRLLAVAAVVLDPGLAQDLPAEAAVPALAVPGVAGERLALLDVEGVRRRPHADDRPARVDVVDDLLHLVLGQVAEPGEEDHQVGVPERLEAWDVARAGVDRPVLADREQDGALKPVPPGEDLRELGQGLLGPILLVAGDEDDVLPLAGRRRRRGRRATGRRPRGRRRGSRRPARPGRASWTSVWPSERFVRSTDRPNIAGRRGISNGLAAGKSSAA